MCCFNSEVCTLRHRLSPSLRTCLLLSSSTTTRSFKTLGIPGVLNMSSSRPFLSLPVCVLANDRDTLVTVRDTPSYHLPHSQLSTIEFISEHPDFVASNNAINYLSDNGGETYKFCLCVPYSAYITVWSNFEIAGIDFWRGLAYTASFDFFKSRGRCPVSTRTVSCSPLMLTLTVVGRFSGALDRGAAVLRRGPDSLFPRN